MRLILEPHKEAPGSSRQFVAVSREVSAQVHDSWRFSHWPTFHGMVPRWKAMERRCDVAWAERAVTLKPDYVRAAKEGGWEVNLLDLPQNQLPPSFAKENIACARHAIRAVMHFPSLSDDFYTWLVGLAWLERAGRKGPLEATASAQAHRQLIINHAKEAVKRYGLG